MADFPLVVSYYTTGTLYQLEVQNLIASLEKWGIPHLIEGIESFGSWELNCAFKPFFLYSKLQELKRPLFWVDADAVFLQKPTLLDAFQADLAVRMNDTLAADHPSKVMSGSLFVNSTPSARDLLKKWAGLCFQRLSDPERTEEFWDQIALRDAIHHFASDVNVHKLPTAYCTIADHPHDAPHMPEAVIAHYQASRRYKRHINEI